MNGLNELSEGLSELSEGLHDFSEELDSNRWKLRLAEFWAALTKLASSRPEAAVWLGQWMPAFFAVQRMLMTVGSLLASLREAVMDGTELNLSDTFFERIRDDFQHLADAFPDASTVIFGMDRIDELVDAALQDEDTRKRLDALKHGLLDLIDDVVSKGIDALLNGESGAEAAKTFTNYVDSIERLVQLVLDRVLDLDGASQ